MHSIFKIDASVNCVFIRHEGKYEPGDFFRFIEAVRKSPEYKKKMNIYIDARDVNQRQVKLNSITKFKNSWANTDREIGPCKMSFLYDDNLGYGIGNQATSIFNSDFVERRPFRSQSEAFRWLNIPLKYELNFE